MLIVFAGILILAFAFILKVYGLLIFDDGYENESHIKSNVSTAQGYFVYKEFITYKSVKKLKAKLPFSIVTIILILLFNISANVSIWPNVKGMTVEDKHNSIVFRNMRGSNCINEFNALNNVMSLAVKSGYRNDDIVKILGKPNAISNDNVYYYYLFPETDGCTAVVEFNNDKIVAVKTKNCN